MATAMWGLLFMHVACQSHNKLRGREQAMAKRTSKERAQRRRDMNRQWQPLEEVPEENLLHGHTGVDLAYYNDAAVGRKEKWFMNNRYQVSVQEVSSEDHGFGDFNITWLSIKPNDESARHDWREYQKIKNELAGPDWEAIEIYPSEDRLVDSANQFHLWCFPPEAGQLPIGYRKRFVMEQNTTTHGSQRGWENNVRPDDLLTEKDFVETLRNRHTQQLERKGKR
jgi:hypothetical protein